LATGFEIMVKNDGGGSDKIGTPAFFVIRRCHDCVSSPFALTNGAFLSLPALNM